VYQIVEGVNKMNIIRKIGEMKTEVRLCFFRIKGKDRYLFTWSPCRWFYVGKSPHPYRGTPPLKEGSWDSNCHLLPTPLL
jgi:hypothetical protein